MKRKGLVFVVSAPSGAGKTSLCQRVLETLPGLKFSISHTTRRPRENEVDGKDYFFVDKADFKADISKGEFLEWAEVHGNLYGTSKKRLIQWTSEGTDVLLDIDTQGAMLLKDKMADAVYIYVLPPSFDILKERLVARGSDAPDEIERRLRKASEEIRFYHHYQYLVVNEVLDVAEKKLEAIIQAERMRLRADNRAWVENRFINRL